MPERLRECALGLDHADAMSIKPTSPCEVETTQITTVESRIIQKALGEAAARIEALETALLLAGETFREYEKLHFAKLATCAPEDDEAINRKGERNRELAEMCEAALSRSQGEAI